MKRENLLRDLGIPQHLADVGVTEDKIELMAADAMKRRKYHGKCQTTVYDQGISLNFIKK